MTQTIQISGMTCGGCVGKVKAALLLIAGVRTADVALKSKSAIIVADHDIPRTVLSKALDVAGYTLA